MISQQAYEHSKSERRTVSIDPTAFWKLALSISIASVLIMADDYLLRLPFETLCILCFLLAFSLVVVTASSWEAGIWAPASTYLLVLVLFHFGLTSVYGFGLLSEAAYDSYSSWLFSQDTPAALLTATIGVASCSAGIHIADITSSRNSSHLNAGTMESRMGVSHDYYLRLVGSVITILASIMWFCFVFLAGGISLLLATYREYLDATATFPMGYVWIISGIGLSFLAASGTAFRQLRQLTCAAYGSFLLFSLCALPLGLRGEILFPVLAACAVASKRGTVPRRRTTILIALTLLLIISGIKEVRQVGIGGTQTSELRGNILDSLTEMGGSLRPTVVVIEWSMEGEATIKGESYWAPIDRALCAFLPARVCIPAQDDDRLLNVVVAERVGNIGFSPIAEAFRNFGRGGVVIVLAIIGVILGAISTMRSGPMRNALAGVILIELLINVRNAFTQVPSHLSLGLSLLLLVLVLGRLFPIRLLNDSAKESQR